MFVILEERDKKKKTGNVYDMLSNTASIHTVCLNNNTAKLEPFTLTSL